MICGAHCGKNLRVFGEYVDGICKVFKLYVGVLGWYLGCSWKVVEGVESLERHQVNGTNLRCYLTSENCTLI